MIRKTLTESSEDFLKRVAEYEKQDLIVEYAYPSSATAKYYKMSKTGCYYIAQKDPKGAKLPRVRFSRMGFMSELEAEKARTDWAGVIR